MSKPVNRCKVHPKYSAKSFPRYVLSDNGRVFVNCAHCVEYWRKVNNASERLQERLLKLLKKVSLDEMSMAEDPVIQEIGQVESDRRDLFK